MLWNIKNTIKSMLSNARIMLRQYQDTINVMSVCIFLFSGFIMILDLLLMFMNDYHMKTFTVSLCIRIYLCFCSHKLQNILLQFFGCVIFIIMSDLDLCYLHHNEPF